MKIQKKKKFLAHEGLNLRELVSVIMSDILIDVDSIILKPSTI